MRNLFYSKSLSRGPFKAMVESVCEWQFVVRVCCSVFFRAAAMERTKKPLLGVTLLFFLLLVSAAHGVQLADAKDVAGDDERVTVKTGHGGSGHGYSSHSGGHPNGGTTEQGGGTGVVDPRNPNARSHHRNGAASRALGYSSWLICTLVGGVVMPLLL